MARVHVLNHRTESNSLDQLSPASPTPVGEFAVPVGANGVRLLAMVALTAALLIFCGVLAAPFFPAITWGVALAILVWPLHRRLARAVPWSGVAAAITTLLVTGVLIAAGMFVTYQLVQETGTAAVHMPAETIEESVRTTLEAAPLTSDMVAWMDSVGLNLEEQVRTVINESTNDLRGVARGSASAALQFLVMAFILFYLLLDRVWFNEALRLYLPISKEECDTLTASVSDSVHANLYATLVTSTINSLGFGAMFYFLGLPAPVVWTAVMFVLSILPIVGAGMVWAPASVYLLLSGQTLSGVVILAWGAFTFIAVDNFLYMRIAGQRMRLHPVPAMVAFLGGLAVFGVSGMILGPAILAITTAAIELWQRRLRNPAGPAKSPPPTVQPPRLPEPPSGKN